MESLYKNLPDTPGVYLMKDAQGAVLYVGKAGNLRRRVSSYFERPHDSRIQKLVSEIRSIDHKPTDTAIEALILEAKLIKEIRPPFNIREKDDKSFLYVEITKEKFPRVLLVRGRDVVSRRSLVVSQYGPFTSASSIREALRILRKIFPWNTHPAEKLGTFSRPCFDAEIGLCPGTCVGAVTKEEYRKNIQNLKLFFQGEKKKILGNLKKEMAAAAKSLEFEKAEKLRRRIFALQHIRDIALIQESKVYDSRSTIHAPRFRIEGYDISNIFGTSAVGSMVVFTNGEPDKNEYRKFKIKTIVGSNDVGMLREMLTRRFARSAYSLARRSLGEGGWPMPHLILIDGGAGQINAAKNVLLDYSLKIPVIGIAKGVKRKRNDIIGIIPKGIEKKTLIRVRDEAHRFAIRYHRTLRSHRSLQ